MTTRQTPDAVREASWTGDPYKLAAELRRVASVFDPKAGFRLPQLLRDAADEIDGLATLGSRAAGPEWVQAGRFLLDRLVDHEVRMTSDADAREWHGHVTPAIARFRAALSHGEGRK